jgi:flagellar motor switch protein FliN/FliY
LSGSSTSVRDWLLGEFPANLAQAFEAMAGAKPECHLESGAAPPPDALLRRQKFEGLEGAVWLVAAETDWVAAGNEVLRAAGIEDGDQPTLKSTYLETIGQALSTLASSITERVGSEVTCAAAEELAVPAGLQWSQVHLNFSSTKLLLYLAFEPALLDHIAHQLSDKAAASEPSKEIADTRGNAPPPESKTFDLLLDVELPVSVSFGRAQVALKDLIKLTTGSIVELNRSISEPVEVIVNNCVIARGEVVVVEGNFGVRIQQVVSRQERLRTLV